MTPLTAARDALAPALARAGAIVPNRTTIAIIQCVLLEASDEGLFVTSTDLDIRYRQQVDAIPRDAWRTCVDTERLEAFVAGSSSDTEIALRGDDEGRLAVRAGRASCRLPTQPAEDFPLFTRPQEGAVELTFDAAAFAAGLRAVTPAMSDEEGRFYLCGAYLHAGRLVATDGHRLALKTVAADVPPAPDVIVPSPTVTRLATLLRKVEGPLSVTPSKTQIIVSTPSWTLTSRVIDGTFPNYQSVLPDRSPCPLLVRREALHSAAALVTKVGHDFTKPRALRLSTVNGELLVASGGVDALGTCEVSIAIEDELPTRPQTVGLNPRYLLSMLDAIDAELVELHIAEPTQPLWLCEAGEPQDGAVIMPIRV